MNPPLIDVAPLALALREFAAARDWQQFHSPKNLAMALSVETAELVEVFQWKTERESRDAAADPRIKQAVADEIADVLIYVTQLADAMGVDVNGAVVEKLVKNARKYPATPPSAA